MLKKNNKNNNRYWVRMRNWVWPNMSWKRWLIYICIKLTRLKGTNNAIAGGFAFGAALSFTPLMGLHIMISIGLAYFLRWNMIAAAIGTIVGNPWTFPFIWWWIYWLGAKITGISFIDDNNLMLDDLNLSIVLEKLNSLFTPMLVGGAITAIPVWFIFFYLIKWTLNSIKKMYKNNRCFKANL